MTKKLVVGGLILVACLFVAKKTNFCSYASTIIASGRDRLRSEIPRELEIARVRNEIQRLDRDYANLLGPIAEKKAAVRRLENEVSTAKASLEERREALKALTNAIDSKEKEIAYLGSNYNLGQAKVRLAKDFATFRKLEVNLDTQEKLLGAQRQNLAATIDQLGKLVDQKREFEIAQAELEANEEMLKATAILHPLKTDDSHVADIANSQKEIRQAQEVERERRALEQQYGSKIGDAQPPVVPVGDLSAIRDHLEGRTTPATKVAQGSK
jgi:chromosome segregation ATPase